MIIRAASDDEDDDDQQRLAGSVFGAGPPGSASRESSSIALLHSAKRVWIATTLALIVLLLVDLAAIMNHFQRRSTDPENQSARDAFAVLPAILDTWSYSGAVFASVYAAPATSVNSVVGSLIVAGWIYSREQSAPATRSRSAQRRRGSSSGSNASLWTIGFPWTPIVGIFCFGHVVSCMYILMALFESNGDRSKFLLGKASTNRTHPRV